MNIQKKQPTVFRLFSTLIKNKRLQHAYLFEGSVGSGRLEMAKWLAQVKLCPNTDDHNMPCGECTVCKRIEQETHPDVWYLRPDGRSIKVDQVRAILREFAKSGMESSKKILIVDPIEAMTISGANSLLKFLEEPVSGVTILLLTENEKQLLPTIISRVQTIHFKKQPFTEIAEHFMQKGIPQQHAFILASLTQDVTQAQEMFQNEEYNKLPDLAWRWFSLILDENIRAFLYVHTDLKNNLNDRTYAQIFLEILILIYRDLLNIKYGSTEPTVFFNRTSEISNYAATQNIVKLLKQMETLFEAKKMLQANVSIQSVMEKVAIKNINMC